MKSRSKSGTTSRRGRGEVFLVVKALVIVTAFSILKPCYDRLLESDVLLVAAPEANRIAQPGTDAFCCRSSRCLQPSE